MILATGIFASGYFLPNSPAGTDAGSDDDARRGDAGLCDAARLSSRQYRWSSGMLSSLLSSSFIFLVERALLHSLHSLEEAAFSKVHPQHAHGRRCCGGRLFFFLGERIVLHLPLPKIILSELSQGGGRGGGAQSCSGMPCRRLPRRLEVRFDSG